MYLKTSCLKQGFAQGTQNFLNLNERPVNTCTAAVFCGKGPCPEASQRSVIGSRVRMKFRYTDFIS